MAGETTKQQIAWRRRQGTPSEQVKSDLEDTLKAKRAKEAATPDNTLSADFADRLAKAQAFAHKHGLKWEGLCTYGTAAALVEFRAARANHLIRGLAARVAELEKMTAGMQAKVDHHEKHALIFAGEFQPTSTYYAGNAVSYRGQLFTALKHIPPGKSAPAHRDGSGWALMV